MKESTESRLLYDDGLEATSNTSGKLRGSSSRYRNGFLIIAGIIGFLLLIPATALTIHGSVGLRDYGFANGSLIAGIVLFGVGGALSIVACVAAGLK